MPEGLDRLRIKEIVEILDPLPLIDGKMLEMTRWMSEYYACSWGQALDAAVPAGVKKHAGTRVGTFLIVPQETREALRDGPITPKLSAKQTTALEILCRDDEPLTISDVCRLAKCSPVPVQALIKQGLVHTVRRRLPVDLTATPGAKPEETHATPAIERPEPGAHRRAIGDPRSDPAGPGVERVRAVPDPRRDRQRQDRSLSLTLSRRSWPEDSEAIVLVPEISLTPQTIRRFRRTLRAGRGAAQPPQRRRAAPALAEHRRGARSRWSSASARPSSRRRGDSG